MEILSFKTKSETLKLLEAAVKKSRVLPQVSFTVRELTENPLAVRAELEEKYGDVEAIVRSSALNEDSCDASQAGKYTSILNISGIDNILQAAQNVAEHFDGYNPDNLIFVQPMLQDILFSGVIFTADPNTCGNYYIINYDDTTGSTSSVTSGSGVSLQTYYLFKQASCPVESLQPVVEAAKELERLFNHSALDIEFAVTSDKQVYIFQVRPLVTKKPIHDLTAQINLLERINNKICESTDYPPPPPAIHAHP